MLPTSFFSSPAEKEYFSCLLLSESSILFSLGQKPINPTVSFTGDKSPGHALGARHEFPCSSLSPDVLPVPPEASRPPACQGPQGTWDGEQLEAQPNLTHRAPWKRDGVFLQPRSPPFLLQALKQSTEGQNPILMCVTIWYRHVDMFTSPWILQSPSLQQGIIAHVSERLVGTSSFGLVKKQRSIPVGVRYKFCKGLTLLTDTDETEQAPNLHFKSAACFTWADHNAFMGKAFCTPQSSVRPPWEIPFQEMPRR